MLLNNLLKAFLETFLTPLLIVVSTLILGLYLPEIPKESITLLSYLPYVLLVGALLISLKLNRNNLIFIIATLTFSYWCMYQTITIPQSSPYSSIFLVTATLLPLNFFLFSIIRNKVIFSLSGLIKTLLTLIQFLTIYHITVKNPGSVRDFFSNGIWSEPSALLTTPDLSTLLLFAAIVVIIFRWFFKRSHIESGLIASLVVMYGTYTLATSPTQFIYGYCSAALIIITGILQNSYNMAYRDELTNIAGRRALNEYLVSLGKNYTIAMLDIDFFKKFNDDYGHAVGDQVLQLVASKMKKITGGGKAFRYGGEEFAIVFNRIAAKKAVPHLEDLRQNIADYQMSIRSRLRPKKNSKGKQHRSTFKIARIVQITISIGVAERNDKNVTTDEVIKAADKALYKAKNKGRNQVCF